MLINWPPLSQVDFWIAPLRRVEDSLIESLRVTLVESGDCMPEGPSKAKPGLVHDILIHNSGESIVYLNP